METVDIAAAATYNI